MAADDLFAFINLIFNQSWLWLLSIVLSIFFVISYLKNNEMDEWLPYDQVLTGFSSPRIQTVKEFGLLVDLLRSTQIKGYVHLIRRELSKILAMKLGISDNEFIAIRSSSDELKKIIPDKHVRMFFYNPDLWMNSVGMRKTMFLFSSLDETKIKKELIVIIEQTTKITPTRGVSHEF